MSISDKAIEIAVNEFKNSLLDNGAGGFCWKYKIKKDDEGHISMINIGIDFTAKTFTKESREWEKIFASR